MNDVLPAPSLPAVGQAAQRPRLLMVTPRFFPLTGGVESHVYEVSRRLARSGLAVTVLTTDTTGQLPARDSTQGVEIIRVPAWPARRDYYFAPALARVIRNGPWDLVHLQSYHTLVAPLAMAAARSARLPYVLTFHGGGHSSRLRHALRSAQRAGLRPLISGAARLIALAQFEVEQYSRELRLPASRFVVIPNGADLPRPPEGGPPPVPGRIASVGRLERYKGHQRILAALPAILEQEPEARLWIAGQGPYEPELRRLAARLGVADRVEIRAIPPDQRAAMAAELSRTALVVLLSEFETHPIAALEALALGRPLLVADTTGLGELARRGWARAIPLDSPPRQVAEAVVAQLRQPLLPAGVVWRSWDDCADDLVDVYHSIMGDPLCAS
jgi:glycosyltransferase involved in cell wall biosynthesis